MPKFDSSKKDLELLSKTSFTIPELESALEFAKCELDGHNEDELKIECKETLRPDLWSTEGVARELLARTGKETGIKTYKVQKSSVEVFVDKNLEKIRPLLVCAIVKDVKIDDNFIMQIVQIQEKIGENFGKRRKEIAIGLYDFDIMKAPIYFKGFKDEEIEFVPLEWKVPLRPTEILTQHEKGKAYAHLLKDFPLFPIVIDSNKVVASMPPIINSQATGKVTHETKNLFVEVTGFDFRTIETALEVMCMALVDRGGKLFSCKVNFPSSEKPYPAKSVFTPTFDTRKMSFDKAIIEKKSGLKLSDKEIITLLKKARYSVSIKKNKVSVEFAAYRVDIMHPVDVVEDILISYGYDKIAPAKIEMVVAGVELKQSPFIELAKEGCIGLGLQEVMTYNLTSKQVQNTNVLLNEDLIEINNAVSSNYAILRMHLFPQLLDFFSKNKGQEFPQKVFEVGTCVSINLAAPNGVKQSTRICIALTHSNTNFTEIKSHLTALCKYLGLTLELKKKQFAFFNDKSSEIIVNGKTGVMGEINQEVINAFGLRKPVTLFEFEL